MVKKQPFFDFFSIFSKPVHTIRTNISTVILYTIVWSMCAISINSYNWNWSETEGKRPKPTPLPHMRLWFFRSRKKFSTTYAIVLFFRSREKFSTTYAIVFFSPDLFMKISNFSKTVHTIFTKFCTVILHPKGPLRVQRHQNRMAGM